MAEYHHYVTMQVRYGDLDPQGHVNNARYLTFLEQARVDYLIYLGIWDGIHFLTLNWIVAETRMTYLTPIRFGQTISIGLKVTRLGNKSLDFQYDILDKSTGQQMATGTTVMVAYDYIEEHSIPIPDDCRQKIAQFEGIPPVSSPRKLSSPE
jgi:acyl-CoA thioester hydrolase